MPDGRIGRSQESSLFDAKGCALGETNGCAMRVFSYWGIVAQCPKKTCLPSRSTQKSLSCASRRSTRSAREGEMTVPSRSRRRFGRSSGSRWRMAVLQWRGSRPLGRPPVGLRAPGVRAFQLVMGECVAHETRGVSSSTCVNSTGVAEMLPIVRRPVPRRHLCRS